MKTQKSMIIVGSAGSGKSRRAIAEAEKRGKYIVTSWDELRGEFGLAILGSGYRTVIVDGLLPKAIKKQTDRELIKRLADDEYLEIRAKYREPQRILAPMFIFTMQTLPSFPMESGEFGRFDIVEL